MKLPINYNKIDRFQRKEVREEYIRRQNGNCHYCGGPLNQSPKEERTINHDLFPEGFFNWPIHLHHNHNTGMTIGAVHSYCNAVLWQYDGE